MSKARRGQLRWLWIAAAVMVIDFMTKSQATMKLTYGVPKEIFLWLNLTLLHNYGAAFSFLNDQPGWQVFFLSALAIIVSLGILVWISRLDRKDNITAIGLSLIMGGALGNVYDRFTYGYVIDFIDIHYDSYHWPAFNIADSAICIGAFLIIIIAIFKNKRKIE